MRGRFCRLRCPGGVALIFVRVNQVLVRLWACRGRMSDRMAVGFGPHKRPATRRERSEACSDRIGCTFGVRGLRPAALGGRCDAILLCAE